VMKEACARLKSVSVKGYLAACANFDSDAHRPIRVLDAPCLDATFLGGLASPEHSMPERCDCEVIRPDDV
jgi:hypothetical protein